MTEIKNYFKQIREWCIFAFFIVLLFIFITNGKYLGCVLEGVNLWFFSVFPALFPYLFIMNIINNSSVTKNIAQALNPISKRAFNASGLCGYAFFISLISGYPVGAKTVSDLKMNDLIGEAEAERASVFCSNCSPVFLITCVGIMADTHFSILLFITHVISAVIVGLIFSFYKRKEKPMLLTHNSYFKKSENVLYESAFSSVISVLIVGALITIFSLFTEILSDLKIINFTNGLFSFIFPDSSISNGLSFGIFESTKGLKLLLSNGISFYSLPVAGFIAGFGGISVIMQSVAYLKKAKIKTAPFLFGKVLTAFVNFFIGFIINLIFLF